MCSTDPRGTLEVKQSARGLIDVERNCSRHGHWQGEGTELYSTMSEQAGATHQWYTYITL